MNQPIQNSQPISANTKKSRTWVWISLTIIFLAAGGYFGLYFWNQSKNQNYSSNPTTNKQNALSLSYKISGGLGGANISLTIDGLGNVNYLDTNPTKISKKYKLPASDSSELNSLLGQIEIDNLKNSYDCTQLNCALDYPNSTLILDRKTITWSKMDESAPQSLKNLVKFLNNILTKLAPTQNNSAEIPPPTAIFSPEEPMR